MKDYFNKIENIAHLNEMNELSDIKSLGMVINLTISMLTKNYKE